MDQNIDQAGLPEQAPEAARPAAGGETAEFLKEMARKLKEREAQLQREIRRARRRAEIIESYTEMLVEARQIATKRMVDEAEALGADAVINIRYGSSSVMQGAAEIIVYGTAVKLK